VPLAAVVQGRKWSELRGKRMPEPQKFFIGISDFFSVLLPGAVFAFSLGLLSGWIRLEALPHLEAESWIAFVVGSYVLGHVLSLFASSFDRGYDGLRSPLAGDPGTSVSWVRRKLVIPAATVVVGRDAAKCLEAARAICDRDMAAVRRGGELPLNVFQWARARLVLGHPTAAALVIRTEADSKLFRSLMLVALLVGAWGAYLGRMVVLLTAGLAWVIAAWCYAHFRSKAITQAYRFVIVLEGREGETARAPASPTPE